MPSYRDEAVVLRTHRLGEADRIVTMLGRERGKLRAVAKGVRRTSSKFGARLEPFMVVDLQCWEGRSLDTVQQAVSLAQYGADIAADYDAYAAASAMVETADRITDADASSDQYFLLIGALRALARRDHLPERVLDSYLLRALSLAGWRPSFDACAKCGLPGPHDRFSAPLGGAVCRRCAKGGAVHVSTVTLALLEALLAGEWDTVDAAPEELAGRASALIAAYAQFHLEKGLRSLDVIDRERHGALAATAPARAAADTSDAGHPAGPAAGPLPGPPSAPSAEGARAS